MVLSSPLALQPSCAGADVTGMSAVGVSPFVEALSVSIHGSKLPEWEHCLWDALTLAAGSLAAQLVGTWSSLEGSLSSTLRADLQSGVGM